jgi:6-pyruvoyltetrahydropterin/6-carboxytetrahydropterin synthase
MSFADLTRKVKFAAAHRYYRPEWSEEENRRVFGACANPHGHGHNYMMEVTVRAPIDPQTGFSANLVQLDDVLESQIVRVFDHQHINHAVPEFGEGKLIPTTENIARYAWDRVRNAVGSDMQLVRIRLHEDDTFYVDYTGND